MRVVEQYKKPKKRVSRYHIIGRNHLSKKGTIMSGTEVAGYVNSIAKNMNIDLSLANYIETERILSKGSSLSDLILKRRNRN
jgi:hypothetical protein